MHTVILISGDDVPAGGFVVGADISAGLARSEADPALDQLIHDLRLAYPSAKLRLVRGATHRVISGMDVVTDVAGDAE